jgi:hypothetical protein
MALSSGSEKSTRSDSDSDSDNEVRDDMLREAKKMKIELRASLEDARTRVAELETQNLDAKLEIVL